jgi:hypothetical protein
MVVAKRSLLVAAVERLCFIKPSVVPTCELEEAAENGGRIREALLENGNPE